MWVVGYTPTLAVGTWAGNNDNSPIVKKVAGYVIAPMWRNFMDKALPLVPPDSFTPPEPIDSASLPAALAGVPFDANGAHSILARVQRDTPRAGAPANPGSDSQYPFWEYSVRLWAAEHGIIEGTAVFGVSFPDNGGAGTITQPIFRLVSPAANARYSANQLLPLSVGFPSELGITSVSYYFDNTFMGTSTQPPFTISIVPEKSALLRHTLRAVGTGFGGTYVSEVNFFVD